MVSSKTVRLRTSQIRCVILACLVISLPTQSMSWFDSTWKKLGVGIAAVVAFAGIVYGFKQYKIHKEKETIKQENVLLSVYASIYDLSIFDKNNPIRSEEERQKIVVDKLEKAITTAHRCRSNNSYKAISIILKRYGNNGWPQGKTPLELAIINDVNAQLIKSIIDEGFNNSSRESVIYGLDTAHVLGLLNKALYRAVECRKDDQEGSAIVQLLLDHRIASHATTASLMVALQLGNKNQARLLLKHGADIHIKCGNQVYNAYNYAHGNQELVRLLDDYCGQRKDTVNGTLTSFPTALTDLVAEYDATLTLKSATPTVEEPDEQDALSIFADFGQQPAVAPQQPHPLSLDADAV